MKKSKLGAKMATEDLEIVATHLYIKFAPKTEQELDNLTVDSTLVLYDYPLDYEIQLTGDYYRDPETPADQPTPQYCAVEVTDDVVTDNTVVYNPDGSVAESRTVKTIILEELFIPDVYYAPTSRIGNSEKPEATMRKINGKMVSVALIDALVEEALRITNNLGISSTANITGKTMNNSWRPAGRIRVWDDSMQTFVGVEGAQVRARRWFTTHRGWVGADGFYSCDGTFKRDANYSIDWDRYDFALQDHWLNGATFNGPKREGNWDLNLRDDKQEYYATIFRAAHHYYYKDIKGLRRPPQNSFWKTKMKIKAFLENVSGDGNLGTHKEERRFLGAQVKIYTYQRGAVSTYSTVIHELAHASHWNMNRSSFDDSESRIKESWAAGVEWELTRVVYPNYSRGYNNRYTGVVVDMIDVVGGNDQVEGYTIRQIEDALNGEKSWISWRNNIKNRYNNATENNLDALFNTWDF
ncbi:hypothetical protein [Flavobacterium sp. I-STPP5a]|uniref:hypothetical protein n=1 Tax=Flavobacterium sp. I-STPP5a TaxID=2590449 RepID=UPI00131BBBB3|nr:hypothetical protein [Flavobacterium sp. I-STPP5a]